MKLKYSVFVHIISIGLVLPIFFQLSGHIFNSIERIVDSNGQLSTLPLPISIIFSILGIICFAKYYRRSFLAIIFIGGLACLMLFSLLMLKPDTGIDQRKLILMLQFLLPTSGLMLGLMFGDYKKYIAVSFLYTLLCFMSYQLVCSWLQHSFTLVQYLYWFSVYAHIQYVPLIFVCAYIFTLTQLWETHKYKLYFLIILTLVYTLASTSFLTIFAYFVFTGIFLYNKVSLCKFDTKTKVIISLLMLLFTACIIFSLPIVYKNFADKDLATFGNQNKDLATVGNQKFNDLMHGTMPRNIQERLDIWSMYIIAITDSTTTLILGHPTPLPREIKSSAHNWYMDLIYNFGLLATLPAMLLIIYTARFFLKNHNRLPVGTLWLAAIVFYLIIIDNNFKVTLRQPYPGIFAYFLWGVLLFQLKSHNSQAA